MLDFDYGAEVSESTGVQRVNPEEGQQYAVLKSVIHLGKIASAYKGKPKPPVNRVVLNLELKGNLVPEGEDECITGLHPETGEPLDHSLSINLMKGDNAMLTKVMAALITKKEMSEGTIKGWDQLIGRPVGLNIKGSDEKVDGKPKYVDIKEVTPAPAALKSQIPALKNPGVGHATLPKLTVEALHECNMYLDVQLGMMKSEEWAAGTHPAIALVEEIRKENPKYATAEVKGDKAAQGDESEQKSTPAAEPEKVDSSEEF